MADQSEVLFEAIQTIVDKTIEDIHFDKTITCTVIDASKADNDEYTVTDGSIEFTATGNGVKYNKNARVYVTVPQGDFSQQKVIIGKLKKDESFSYNYIAPFDRFVQGMDFNKQKQNIKDRFYGTNIKNINDKVNSEKYFEELIFKILPEGTEEGITDNVIVAEKGSIPISGYDRLGVRATFRSFNIQSGNYGLLIKLYNNPKKEPLAKLKINANTDMFGNIYNFSTYMPQEKIFDISSIKDKIISIEVYFFTENIVIEGKDFPDDLDILSVKNIELIFGYDAESKFKENSLLLYSKNGEKYDANNPQLKILAIADIENENGQFTVNRDINNSYSGKKFRWYRWNIFKQNENGEYEINTSDNYWKEIEFPDEEPQPKITYEFSPNYDLEYEQIRVDLVDKNDNVLKSSNILRLDNINENIQMKNIMGLVQNLKLTTDNDGSFFIYNSNGMLLNPSDRTRRRKLYAEYKSITTGFNNLDGSEDIFWEIPKNNSMLTPIIRNDTIYEYSYNSDDKKQRKCSFEINLVDSIPAEIISDTNKYNYYQVKKLKITENQKKDTDPEDNWVTISSSEPGAFKDAAFYIEYSLNDFYSQQRINNSVSCFIIRNGSVYKATKNFTFGITGNNGSKNTLVAEIVTHDFSTPKTIEKPVTNWPRALISSDEENNSSAPTSDEENNSFVYCRFQLRDQENNNIEEKKLEYSLSGPQNITIEQLGVDDEQFHYYKIIGDSATILTCTVQYEGQTFETQLPIPCAKNGHNNDIYQGPEYIIYDSGNSNPNYYKDELKLFDSELNEILINENNDNNKLDWKIEVLDNNQIIIDASILSMFPSIKIDMEIKEDEKLVFNNIFNQLNDNSFVKQLNDIDTNQSVENYVSSCIDIVKNFYNPSDDNNIFPNYFGNNDDTGLKITSEGARIIFDNDKKIIYDLIVQDGKIITSNETIKNIIISKIRNFIKDKFYTKECSKIICPSLYVENENLIKLIAYKGTDTYWVQPLIMMATPYGSPLLNQWDGQLSIDEENNTIMSSIVGAGRKDSSNRFSGVLMGEIGKAAPGGTVTSQTTGLLGFDKGIQTFKLDTNGQMTIGAAGKGQIEMNGNSGSIKSGNFSKTNNTGMEINLTDSNFNMGGRITMDGSEDISKPYFAIKEIYTEKDQNGTDIKKTKSLLEIEKSDYNHKGKYFLQSSDYAPNKYTGFKLDLRDGKIEGYNAKISFSNGNLNTGIWTRTILGNRCSIEDASKSYDVEIGLSKETEEENINTILSSNTKNLQLDFVFIPMMIGRASDYDSISYSWDKAFGTKKDYYGKITSSKIQNVSDGNFHYIGSYTKKCCYKINEKDKPSDINDLTLYRDYNEFYVLFKFEEKSDKTWILNFYNYENNNFYNVKTGNLETEEIENFYNDPNLKYGYIKFFDEKEKVSYKELYTDYINNNKKNIYFVATSSSFKVFEENNSIFKEYGKDSTNKKDNYQWCQIEDLYGNDSYDYWIENINWFRDTSIFLKGKSFNVEVGRADELKLSDALESLHLYAIETITVKNGKVKEDEENKKWFYVDPQEKNIVNKENETIAGMTDSFIKNNSSKVNKLVIDSSQALYPFNINSKFKIAWDGTFEATAGTIGGWLVDSNKLVSNNGAVGMARFAGYNKPIFWAGGTSKTYEDPSWTDKVAFGVSGNGKLYSNWAHIGAWELTNSHLQGSGNIQCNGNIYGNKNIYCDNYYGQTNEGSAQFHGTASYANKLTETGIAELKIPTATTVKGWVGDIVKTEVTKQLSNISSDKVMYYQQDLTTVLSDILSKIPSE